MLIVLTNCQTEDLVLKNESITKSKAIVTKLNYEQFLKQQNVKSTVEKLKKIELTKISNSKNRSNTLRAIVTIDSSSINQVIKNGVVSYTFKVLNSDLEANTFENLVIQTDTTQQTNAYLIKYTPSITLGMGIPFEGIKEITPLDSSTTINTTNKTTVCISITTYTNYYLCDEGVVQSPETCDYQYTTESTETSCETLSDGAGGNSDSIVFYSNDGGGGGSPTPDSNYDGSDTSIHGNGSNSVNTAPVTPEVDLQQPIPCQQLKNMNNRTVVLQNGNTQTVLQNLNDLANNISTPRERGYLLEPDATQTLLNEHYYEGPLNSDEIEMNLGNMAIDIIMHTHYNTNQLSVFSLADLYQIYYSMNVGNIYSPTTFTSILVTAHGTKYALKITDPTAFLNWGNTFFYGWDLALPAGTNNPLIDKSENQYSKFVSNNFSNTLNENGLAKFIENLGVELYSSNSNFSQWSKITPNMNGIPTKTTCP
jgi:hypothetical protein